jgi:hypothetical protein
MKGGGVMFGGYGGIGGTIFHPTGDLNQNIMVFNHYACMHYFNNIRCMVEIAVRFE